MTGKRGRAAAALALGAAAIFATFAGAGVGGAAKGKHGVRLRALAHFNQPTFAAGPPNSKHLVFVTERPGRIKVLHGDRKGGTFLDMSGLVNCCVNDSGPLLDRLPA